MGARKISGHLRGPKRKGPTRVPFDDHAPLRQDRSRYAHSARTRGDPTAAVAQEAEHRTINAEVAGSNPASGPRVTPEPFSTCGPLTAHQGTRHAPAATSAPRAPDPAECPCTTRTPPTHSHYSEPPGNSPHRSPTGDSRSAEGRQPHHGHPTGTRSRHPLPTTRHSHNLSRGKMVDVPAGDAHV